MESPTSPMKQIFLCFSILLGGCTDLISPSRMLEDNLQQDIADRKVFFKKPELSVIGHGAAAFRDYPMNIVKVRGRAAAVRSNNWLLQAAYASAVKDSLERAFNRYQLDAVEIDIQLPPADHSLCKATGDDCAFIMHDTPQWEAIQKDDVAYDYLLKNRLSQVLEAFVNAGFHHDKTLYLELKTSAACQVIRPEAELQCDSVASRVRKVIQPYLVPRYVAQTKIAQPEVTDIERKRPWLQIVSFSPSAMASLYAQLPESQRQYVGFSLVAGFTEDASWPMSLLRARLSQLKGPVPVFDEQIQDFVAANVWIERVWFSPKGMSEPVTIMRNLQQRRLEQDALSPLGFSVSVYDTSLASFEKKMAGFDDNLLSFMVDVDRASK